MKKGQPARTQLRDEIVSLTHQRDAVVIQAQNLRNQLVEKDREINALKHGHQMERERALSHWIDSVATINRSIATVIGEGANRITGARL